MSRRILLLCAGLLAIGAAISPTFENRTNCGGNSAALARVHEIALIAWAATFDSPDHPFRFLDADPAQREQLKILSRSHWLPTARFLVSTAPVVSPRLGQRRIIVVCDTPYRNVPWRWIGSAPPAYAAGYSDGSYGLISAAEFAKLAPAQFTLLIE